MLTDRQRFLIISSLRQRATQEAQLHYGGDLAQGIAGELEALAAELEPLYPAVPQSAADDWLG